jgi:hypothetical protein
MPTFLSIALVLTRLSIAKILPNLPAYTVGIYLEDGGVRLTFRSPKLAQSSAVPTGNFLEEK